MLSKEQIEEIRLKNDIVAVVSEHVKLRKTGKNFIGLCPFHSEKTPSFTVSPEKQIFHCFGCGEGGNLFSFIMKLENIGFGEALHELGERVGIAVAKTSSGSAKGERDRLYDIMKLAAKFYQQALPEAASYLTERGVSESTAKIFSLGAAPAAWDELFKQLIARGASPQLIEAAGLTLPREEKGGYYDRFRARLMFPVADSRGRVIAFSGRSLKNEEPKYLNSPETALFRKGENIFGLHITKEAIKKEKTAILVEGNLDLVTVYQAGFQNVGAPLGTALTQPQAKLLARLAETVVLALDADAAGVAAALRAGETLRAEGLKVKIAEIQGAKDPDELIRTKGAEKFRQIIMAALPYLEYRLKKGLSKYDLNSIEDRSRALREAGQLLGQEKDPFIQKEYAKQAAELLRVDLETVLAEAKRDNFYRQPTGKDQRRVTAKPPSKVAEAEKKLIGLAVEDPSARTAVKEKLTPASFQLPEARTIAEIILTSKSVAGDLSQEILENITDEKARSFLSAILVGEKAEDHESVLRDCLQVLETDQARARINVIKLELKEAEQAGNNQKVAALLNALKTEISEPAGR